MACSLSYLTVNGLWAHGACDTGKENICELKRLWFYKDYRGQGLGRLMTQRLLDFATAKGYQRIRLDVADAAGYRRRRLSFISSSAFTSSRRYNDGPCSVFMEKILGENFSTSDAYLQEREAA